MGVCERNKKKIKTLLTRAERVIATLIERPAFPVVDHVVNQRPVAVSEILTDSPAE